jgi:hypothetical protein
MREKAAEIVDALLADERIHDSVVERHRSLREGLSAELVKRRRG